MSCGTGTRCSGSSPTAASAIPDATHSATTRAMRESTASPSIRCRSRPMYEPTVATSRPATTRVPLNAHPTPSWEKFCSHQRGSAAVTIAKSVPITRKPNRSAARSDVRRSMPAPNAKRPPTAAATPVRTPPPTAASCKPWRPAASTSAASSTPITVTAPNAMVRAPVERSDTTACHRGIEAVSPRRCTRVLVRNAPAAMPPATTAAGIASAPPPVSGRASPPSTSMPATAPTTKQSAVAQIALVSPRSFASCSMRPCKHAPRTGGTPPVRGVRRGRQAARRPTARARISTAVPSEYATGSSSTATTSIVAGSAPASRARSVASAAASAREARWSAESTR